jgi:hypothetical protein
VQLEENHPDNVTADDSYYQSDHPNESVMTSSTTNSSPSADRKQTTVDPLTSSSFGSRYPGGNGESDTGKFTDKQKNSMFSCHLCTYICKLGWVVYYRHTNILF